MNNKILNVLKAISLKRDNYSPGWKEKQQKNTKKKQ